MRKEAFEGMLESVGRLTPGQRNALVESPRPISWCKSSGEAGSVGCPVYEAFAKSMAIVHESVNLSAHIRIRQAFHVQNVNAYYSRLKAWIARFHGVGTYYLPNYLGWHRLLDGHSETLTPSKLIRVSLGADHYQRTTRT